MTVKPLKELNRSATRGIMPCHLNPAETGAMAEACMQVFITILYFAVRAISAATFSTINSSIAGLNWLT